jgi:hypothetical protein
MSKFSCIGVCMLAALASASAVAGTLSVSSYSMFNGGTGLYDYRDFTYLPCAGVCDVTGAQLSGGTGKLTDGVLPADSWYQYGYLTPWVAWYSSYPNETNPTVTFYFDSTVTVDSVTVWVDNSLLYDVSLPSAFSVDGIVFPIAYDATNPAPRAYTLSGLNITGDSVDVQFFQGSQPWLAVGEVSFDGSLTVPEPATWALMAGGLALALLRRR